MNSKLIVYPTDFSDCAKNAMQYVIAIGIALKCKIKIVHSIDISTIAASEENPKVLLDIIAVLKEKVEKKLIKIKKEIQNFNLDCDFEIIVGNALFLEDYLGSFEPLMIVMGTIGNKNLENKLFGSLASKTIRNTKSIVLAVPEKAKFSNLSEIVFATNYHFKDKNILEFINKITTYYKAVLRVIHICDDINNVEKEHNRFLKFENEISKTISHKNIHFELLYGENAEDKLLEYIDKVKPDILGLITRKTNFIERVFDKSLSNKMVNYTNIPVLVFS